MDFLLVKDMMNLTMLLFTYLQFIPSYYKQITGKKLAQLLCTIGIQSVQNQAKSFILYQKNYEVRKKCGEQKFFGRNFVTILKSFSGASFLVRLGTESNLALKNKYLF